MVLPRPPLVVHVVHSLEGGGTERMLVALLGAFDRRVMRHAVITLRDAGSLAAALPDDVACIALETVGRSRASALHLARICARLRPSIIHARNVCTWSDAVIARLFHPRAKLILGFHGLQNGGHFSPRDRRAVYLGRVLGACFTSVSQHGARQLMKECRVPNHRIAHLPNGVDLCRTVVSPEDTKLRMRASFGYFPYHFVVGIVGSLTPVKGHAYLLAAIADAARFVPAIRLLVIGDGPLRGELEALARSLAIDDRVQFTGWRDDAAMMMNAMDTYVCASDSEGMSNALMEAMALGMPIVSTEVGDHPAMLRNGKDGLLVPPGHAAALAQSLQTLFHEPDLAAALGQNARRRIEAFDFERTVEAYQHFYHGLLATRAAPLRRFARICRGVSKSVISSISPRIAADTPVK